MKSNHFACDARFLVHFCDIHSLPTDDGKFSYLRFWPMWRNAVNVIFVMYSESDDEGLTLETLTS